ncbi:hypothetical protein ABLA30_19770 [Xenorhabdus nematophila]|uniref:hypothetical protein n=1 Tax=Xenorhabdus nematophila TaxID=628 RepID=UPI00032757BA|nr:hypothetical protein [Xenorhabdus nematophila]CCW32422.1 conserved exported hypothetical protein [Xenorhabdus nematophila F1]
MDIKSIAIAAVLGVAGGFGGSYYVMNEQTASIHERLNQTPPVVVVDFAKVVSAYPAGASPEEVEKLMVKTNKAILKLKNSGYLVLDASAVVGAPSDVYLPEEVLK